MAEGSRQKTEGKKKKAVPLETEKKKKKKAPARPPAKGKVVYFGTGRRKDAVARVRLIPGKGSFSINGRELEEYFGLGDRLDQIKKPFKVTNTLGKFDVKAAIHGGGATGQAGAFQHGIARALLSVDGDFRDVLKKARLLTRDSRMKERRKYGLKKARKAPQFSKR